MNTLFKCAVGSVSVMVLSLGTQAHADVPDGVLQQSFFPFKAGVPKANGISPGMVINKANADIAKSVLPPTLYDVVKKGDYSIEVQDVTDFPLHAKFIEATKKYADKVSINPDGTLKGFVAGRPFPQQPDIKDPQAGLKLAWNFQYGRVWGDLGCMDPWYWQFKNYETGKIEKTIKWDKICFKRMAFRTVDDPTPEVEPNPSQLYRAIYGRIVEPTDLKNTQLLIQKYKDDTKLNDAYLYLGFQRRVRRLATGQTTDAFLGSDVMLEDFEGFNGKVTDFAWTYKETRTMLLPWYDRSKAKNLGKQFKTANEDATEYHYTSTTGQGNCYPDIPWQMRQAHIIEQKPKSLNHPVGKRVYYMDAQTNEMGVIEIFDRKGELWKMFFIGWANEDRGVHPINKGKGADLGDIAMMIDLQAKHCTTAQFRGRIDAGLAPDSLFSVQNMRGGD